MRGRHTIGRLEGPQPVDCLRPQPGTQALTPSTSAQVEPRRDFWLLVGVLLVSSFALVYLLSTQGKCWEPDKTIDITKNAYTRDAAVMSCGQDKDMFGY